MSAPVAQAGPPRTGSASAQPGTPATTTSSTPATRPGRSERRRVPTPRALRWWTFATALACAVFALVTLVTMSTASSSATRASDDAEQLIRVQTIRADLLRADALATNSYLVGGLDAAGQRAAYLAALDDTTTAIAHAAAAQPADREALAQLNTAVTRYAAATEQARSTSGEDFEAGADRLTRASQEMRDTALPLLDALVAANEQRATQQLTALDHPWFEVAGFACLVVLLAAMVWTARRFHRVVNVGLLLAALLVLATWIIGGSLLATARSSAAETRNGDLHTISLLGQARAAANEAKVQESLRLITRGYGDMHEEEWKQASSTVTDLTGELARGPRSPQFAAQLSTRWQAYVDAHTSLVRLDTKDTWDEAVTRATSDASGAPNATFTAFDELAAQSLTERGAEVRRSTEGRSRLPFVMMVTGVPVLVVAGVSAGVGLRTRLREYL